MDGYNFFFYMKGCQFVVLKFTGSVFNKVCELKFCELKFCISTWLPLNMLRSFRTITTIIHKCICHLRNTSHLVFVKVVPEQNHGLCYFKTYFWEERCFHVTSEAHLGGCPVAFKLSGAGSRVRHSKQIHAMPCHAMPYTHTHRSNTSPALTLCSTRNGYTLN